MKKLLFTLLGGAYLLTALTSAQAQMLINGAGTHFPFPLFEMVRRICHGGHVGPFQLPSHRLRRRPEAIPFGTVDFGASDVPDEGRTTCRGQGPSCIFRRSPESVVITYNLPGDPTLKFDGPTVADVFLGKIRKWNDPRITALNPGVKLPDETSWWCMVRTAAARRASLPPT